MHSNGENLANKPYAGEKSANMPCDRAELPHMRHGASKSISMRCVMAQSAQMHCSGGKAPACLVLWQSPQTCSRARQRPHMHYDGVTCDHMPCGGGNVQVHAELGGVGAKSGHMPYSLPPAQAAACSSGVSFRALGLTGSPSSHISCTHVQLQQQLLDHRCDVPVWHEWQYSNDPGPRGKKLQLTIPRVGDIKQSFFFFVFRHHMSSEFVRRAMNKVDALGRLPAYVQLL